MTELDPLPDEKLAAVEQEIAEMYRERIEEKGQTPEGLFWDSQQSMETRFEVATELYDFEGASVLDVGCGFGDFYGFLHERGIEPESYLGIDISDTVLEVATERHPDTTFEHRNLLREPFEDDRQFDVSVAFGTLGHDFETLNNEAYFRQFTRVCFASSRSVILNALSRFREGDWPREEFVYYYDPRTVFGYAQELTRNVVLRHDVPPIPQKEFFLLLGPPTDDELSDDEMTSDSY